MADFKPNIIYPVQDDQGNPQTPIDAFKDTWSGGTSWSQFPDQFQKSADVVGAYTGMADDFVAQNQLDNRSIISRVQNSIIQFPVFISQSCPVNAATIIAQMFGRVYTTYVQMQLAMNPILDEDQVNNMKFLKQFHSNIKENAAMKEFIERCGNLINMFYEPIDEHDQMMQDSIYCKYQLTENMSIEFQMIPTMDEHIIAESRRLSYEPLTGFNYLKEAEVNGSLVAGNGEELVQDRTGKVSIVKEEELRNMAIEMADLPEGQLRLIEMRPSDIKMKLDAKYHLDTIEDEDAKKQAKEEYDEELQGLLDDRDEALHIIDERLADLKKDIRDGKLDDYTFNGVHYLRYEITDKKQIRPKAVERPQKTVVDDAVPVPMILKEGEIRKINDMLPYTIKATFRIKGKNGINDRNVEFLVGIKAILHLIRVQDLVDELSDMVMGNERKFQKVRYKSGEIRWKDYMFNTKKLKADALKSIDSNKRWISTLKRLGEYTRAYGSVLKRPVELINGQIPIPNGTLVLTQPDVTVLSHETGIDLSQLSNAARLCKSLFLIGICIIDASAGTLRVYYPSESHDWQIQSLASVDAENAKTDNSNLMKELNKLVNRG